MGGSFTVEDITESLNDALDRYRERENAGDDMAEAGRELAEAVKNRLTPKPFGPPSRNLTILEMVYATREVEDIEFIREQVLLPGSQDTEKTRWILQAIDHRLNELRELKDRAANPRRRSRAKKAADMFELPPRSPPRK